MNKIILTITLFLSGGIALESVAQSADEMRTIRNELFYTDFDFDKCKSFYDGLIALKAQSPLIEAYRAAAESLMAKHTWNPISKISYLKHALKVLNNAVNSEIDNPEIRFLRLYIQRSIPSYMGLSDNISEDKAAILKYLDKLDAQELGQDIANYIAKYMSTPDLVDAVEASLIKSKLGVAN